MCLFIWQKAHFFAQNFRTNTLLLKFFFFTHHHVSHVLPERGREARVHAQGTKTLYITSLSLWVRRSFVVARFCLVFFSLCWNTQNNINFDREFITRNSPPAALSFFSLMLDRKRVRMGNRRCRRTRRDSRRTISSRNRESRAKNGSGYFSRSNRRSSFKSSKIWIRDWISREEREKET